VSEVKIREANISDAASIARLSGQLGYPATPEELEERLLSILQKKKHRVYVAELPDKLVVGWIHVFGTQYLMAESLAEVGGLIVDESNRGHGIGRALVETAEEWAVTMGYRYLRIRSNIIRTEAHRFYKRMGYNWAKTSLVFVKSLVHEHSEGEVCV
jgi:GNAT superfamily N-acetyltransferase